MKSTKVLYLLFVLIFLNTNSILHAQDCYPRFVQEGKTALKNLDFDNAIKKFKAAEVCNDRPNNDEITKLISETKDGYIVAIKEEKEKVKAEKEKADQQTRMAKSRELVLHAEANLVKDKQLSLLLSRQAVASTWEKDRIVCPEAENILRRAIMAVPRTLVGHNSGVECLAWSRSGNLLASGDQDGVVLIWDIATWKLVAKLEGGNWLEEVRWSHDDQFIAAGDGGKNQVLIWKTDTWEHIKTIKFKNSVQSVDWRLGHRQLAIGLALGDNSPTVVYDLDKDKELYRVKGMRAAYSPDGHLLASGGGDGVVKIFEAETGTEIASIPGHSRYVHSIKWSPNGKRIATASVDDQVIIWNVEEKAIIKRLSNDFALSVNWSTDGNMIASGNGGSYVPIWDANSFAEIFRITAPTTLIGSDVQGAGASGYVLEVEWSHDGVWIAVADRNSFISNVGGLVLLYPSKLIKTNTIEDLLLMADFLATRELTPSEKEKYLSFSLCPIRK